jgi:hypothetical protein
MGADKRIYTIGLNLIPGIEAALPIEQISATLALMELKGMVQQVGGMRYIAVKEAQAAYHAELKKDE